MGSAAPVGFNESPRPPCRPHWCGMLVLILSAGCARAFDLPAVTMPPPEMMSAAVISTYPVVALACVQLHSGEERRRECVLMAREAFEHAVGQFDGKINNAIMGVEEY